MLLLVVTGMRITKTEQINFKKYTVKSGKKEKQTNKQIKEKNFKHQLGSIFPKLAFIAFKVLFDRYKYVEL